MSILNDILVYKKEFVDAALENVQASSCENDFMAIFEQFAVIAECKSTSPSEGTIVADYDPVKIANSYQQAGASAVSVLTDEKFFGGSFSDLAKVRQSIKIPLLCKDFIIDEKQIFQARNCGASACLLIMAMLSDEQSMKLKGIIESFRMTAVIEVFDQAELERALRLSPQVILINNRNLRDFTVSFNALDSLCELIPDSIKIIAASGIECPSDVRHLPKRVNGVLIGTALMRSEDKMKFIKNCLMLRPSPPTPFPQAGEGSKKKARRAGGEALQVKICGITNLNDALFAEKYGADYLGFIFAKTSKRFISYENASAIIAKLTTAKAVGIFVDDDFEEIEKVAGEIGLTVVQLYAPLTRRLNNVNVIQAVKVEETIDQQAVQNPYADFYLLDAAKQGQFGGLGLTFDWSLIPKRHHNLFLAGGISLENIDKAIEQPVCALDISSSVEMSPGVKDHQKLKALLQKVKT